MMIVLLTPKIMDTVTIITHTDGTRSVRYGAEHIGYSRGIEQYRFQSVTPEVLKEIKTTTTDKIQALLSKLF